MNWGLFGGTFDPVHVGHLRAAEEIAALMDLGRVIFIPAADPPHKSIENVTSFAHRFRMTKLAVADNARFDVSDLENHREGKSYSIETVRYYLDAAPADTRLYFITGQDAFDAITTWRDWEELLGLCDFIVITRPRFTNKGLEVILPAGIAVQYTYDATGDRFTHKQGRSLYFRATTFLDVSSSEIRRRVRDGQSVRYLLSDEVIDYIKRHRLYGSGGQD